VFERNQHTEYKTKLRDIAIAEKELQAEAFLQIPILKKELEELNVTEPEKLLEQLHQVQKKFEYINTYNEIQLCASEIRKIIPEEKPGEKLSEVIAAKRNEYLQSIQEVSDQIDEIKVCIAQTKLENEDQNCPNCGSQLSIINGKIQNSTQNKDLPSIDDLKQRLKCLQEIKQSAQDRIDSIKSIYDKAMLLKSRLGQDPAAWCKIEDLAETLNRLTDDYNNAVSVKATVESKRKLLRELEKDYAESAATLSSLRRLLKTPDRTLEEVDSDLKLLEFEGETVGRHIKATDDLLERIRSIRIQTEDYNRYRDRLSSIRQNQERVSATLQQVTIDRDDTERKIKEAGLLSEIIQASATASLESITEQINIASAKYLDIMFEDTSVRLVNTKRNKDGKESAKFAVEIMHNGEKVDKLYQLSGGERSRVILAFQLGLNELYNSPILLIDEGLSGLGSEDREICLDAICQLGQQKLVIMAEHMAEYLKPDQYFDMILDLDNQ
jgi:DNA repair exonuclease SbcCD ATPase subunit